MRARAVNLKHEDCDVLVARPSAFGNPYSHRSYSAATVLVGTRAAAIGCYERWLKTRPDLIARCRRELKGKRLGCWCVPLACHAEVLARVAEMTDAELVAWSGVVPGAGEPVAPQLGLFDAHE